MSLFQQPISAEQQAEELKKMLAKAFMPTRMGISPAHGVVFFAGKESELSISEVVVAVRVADVIALAASLSQQMVVPILDAVPTEPLPRVKKPHKLFQVLKGGES